MTGNNEPSEILVPSLDVAVGQPKTVPRLRGARRRFCHQRRPCLKRSPVFGCLRLRAKNIKEGVEHVAMALRDE
jgi:hypothetical protein